MQFNRERLPSQISRTPKAVRAAHVPVHHRLQHHMPSVRGATQTAQVDRAHPGRITEGRKRRCG